MSKICTARIATIATSFLSVFVVVCRSLYRSGREEYQKTKSLSSHQIKKSPMIATTM